MPELPEVETIKRGLSNKIADKKITDVWVAPSFQKKISPYGVKFVSFLKGKSIKSVIRRAKMLIFELSSGDFLLCHLKMTGQLVYLPARGRATIGGHSNPDADATNSKFNRVKFYFSDKSKLFYNDLRKFGYFKIVDTTQLEEEMSKYGVEPLSPAFTFEYFNNVLNKRPKQKIKIVLMNQELIAGIGNIYADESCFASRIKPTRVIKTLSLIERKELFKQIKNVLEKAIKHEGTSVNTYVNSEGAAGEYRKFLKVYNREGERCLRCKKGIIVKEKHGGRGTSWCPRCQK